MQITPLGVCAQQTAKYDTTSFLVSAGNELVVLDCGPSVVKQLLAARTELANISTVIVTHSHGDHTAGFTYLLFSIQLARLQGGRDAAPVTIVCSDGVWEGLTTTLAFHYPPGEFHLAPLRHVNASSSDLTMHRGDGLTVSTIPVSHAVPTIGVKITDQSGIASFSSDTVFCEAFADMAKGSSILFHEAMRLNADSDRAHKNGHSTSIDAAKAATWAGVSRLFLCHVADTILDRQQQTLIREVRASFNGRVEIPEVLAKISIRAGR